MNNPGTAHAAPPIARLSGVTHRYGKVRALEGVDFELSAGQVVALLGPNGAGKSTAVGLLLGLLRPTEGRVDLFGMPPTAIAARRRVGSLLQIAKVPETLTVAEHLELTAAYYPKPLPLAETVRLAGLEGLQHRRFGRLSGGQQQRLLFALAICGDPDLVFLDEPTVGLDPEARQGLWSCVRSLAERGKSVLLTTHYMEEADALASRVVLLHRGQVVIDAAPDAVRSLVETRRIRCRSSIDPTVIAGWTAVEGVEVKHGEIEIVTTAAEETVRRLLHADPQLSALEVQRASLEQALVALTKDADKEAA